MTMSVKRVGTTRLSMPIMLEPAQRRPVSWQGFSDCDHCPVRHLTLFANLTHDDLAAMHYPVDEIRVRAGANLFTSGERADYLFTVRKGLIKTAHVGPGRAPRITGLHGVGDLLGLPAWMTGTHQHGATAVLPSLVCRLPISSLRELERHTPRFSLALQEQWAKSLADAQQWFIDLSEGSVSQRLARLLLRFPRDDDDRIAVCSRREMGDMLGGVTFETVSRTLSAFARQGIVESLDPLGRRYRIDLPAMRSEAQRPRPERGDEADRPTVRRVAASVMTRPQAAI